MAHGTLSDEMVLTILAHLGQLGADLRKLSKMTGGLQSASLLLYLAGRCGMKGSVLKTNGELTTETGLTERKIRQARAQLERFLKVRKVQKRHTFLYLPKTRAIALACRKLQTVPMAAKDRKALSVVYGSAIFKSDRDYMESLNCDLAHFVLEYGPDTLRRALRVMRKKYPPDKIRKTAEILLEGICSKHAIHNDAPLQQMDEPRAPRAKEGRGSGSDAPQKQWDNKRPQAKTTGGGTAPPMHSAGDEHTGSIAPVPSPSPNGHERTPSSAEARKKTIDELIKAYRSWVMGRAHTRAHVNRRDYAALDAALDERSLQSIYEILEEHVYSSDSPDSAGSIAAALSEKVTPWDIK